MSVPDEGLFQVRAMHTKFNIFVFNNIGWKNLLFEISKMYCPDMLIALKRK